jgi:NADH:ubiquinone oxidoreductase subunit 4 (subunit M)
MFMFDGGDPISYALTYVCLCAILCLLVTLYNANNFESKDHSLFYSILYPVKNIAIGVTAAFGIIIFVSHSFVNADCVTAQTLTSADVSYIKNACSAYQISKDSILLFLPLIYTAVTLLSLGTVWLKFQNKAI